MSESAPQFPAPLRGVKGYNAPMAKFLTFLALLAVSPAAVWAGQPLANIDVVAIDAGHGDDPGGRRGDALEKGQCVLIAQALKEIIERENGASVKTVLTFKSDAATSQRERAFAANGNGAKVFVSIHGHPAKQQEYGVYVPYAVDEPTSSWKNAGSRFLSKSVVLAEKLKDSLESGLPGKKYFVGHAPLVMFYGVAMPAVAIEATEYDSQPALNPESAAKIAQAIYSGLVEYGKNP